MLKTLSEAPITAGTRVLLRSNLNVPVRGGHVVDTFRIEEALPTIEFLREQGARTIILAHTSDKGGSLTGAYEELSKSTKISFIEDVLSADGKAEIEKMSNGDCVLAENIRRYPEEEQNDDVFAKKLAKLADIFVQDDFSVAHRAHASVVGIPKHLPSVMGLRFEREYMELSKAFSPEHPAILILGGAKSDTKLPLALSLSDVMDFVFISGVSGNTLLRAAGRNTGESVIDEVSHEILKEVLSKKNISTYADMLVRDGDGDEFVVPVEGVDDSNTIIDAGPETTASIVEAISRAKFVLWNGPLGFYEEGHTTATHEVARAIALSGAQSIVGGGDTRAAIAVLGLEKKISFISTAGGAMVEFLAQGTLPGVDALKD